MEKKCFELIYYSNKLILIYIVRETKCILYCITIQTHHRLLTLSFFAIVVVFEFVFICIVVFSVSLVVVSVFAFQLFIVVFVSIVELLIISHFRLQSVVSSVCYSCFPLLLAFQSLVSWFITEISSFPSFIVVFQSFIVVFSVLPIPSCCRF